MSLIYLVPWTLLILSRTGWKSIFPVGGHVQYINDLTKEESDVLLKWFVRLVQENHDLQVRFKWNAPNDLGTLVLFVFVIQSTNMMIAIWDNRSVFHSATFDYQEHGERFGNRAVGLGEAPFLDPSSTSRREALGQVQV